MGRLQSPLSDCPKASPSPAWRPRRVCRRQQDARTGAHVWACAVPVTVSRGDVWLTLWFGGLQSAQDTSRAQVTLSSPCDSQSSGLGTWARDRSAWRSPFCGGDSILAPGGPSWASLPPTQSPAPLHTDPVHSPLPPCPEQALDCRLSVCEHRSSKLPGIP